jgi:hypothetical protein
METVIAAKAKMYAAIVTRPNRVQEREESARLRICQISRRPKERPISEKWLLLSVLYGT